MQEYTDKSLNEWGLKGTPGKDKHHEEVEAANIIADHLGLHIVAITSEPKKNLPPDVAVDLDTGIRVGIEVTELVDEKTRGQHGKRRAAERKKGLSQKDVFDTIIHTGIDPFPDHISPFAVADWNDMTVAAKLDEIIQEKDRKLSGHTEGYGEIWLAIHTDQMKITCEMLLLARLN